MPPSGPPPANARPTPAPAARFLPTSARRRRAALSDMNLLVVVAELSLLRHFAFLPERLTRRTVRVARVFVDLRAFALRGAFATTGVLNIGSADNAVSPSVLTDVSTVLLACFHSELAVAIEVSIRSPSTRIA